MEQVIRLELRNNLSDSEIIINAVEKYWKENQLKPENLFNIHLAIDEIFSNVVRHAFEDDNQYTIIFSSYKRDDFFIVEFVDDGKPFNPLEQAEPDINTGLDEREPGGLGIFLVKNFSENVNYTRENSKNKLSITFNLDTGDK